MKRTYPQSIADVLRATLEDNRLDRRLHEQRAISLWPDIIGQDIASLGPPPEVNRGVMTIRIANASLRQELSMSRSALIRHINNALGQQTITEIRFIG